MKNVHLVSLDSSAHLVQPEEFDEISLDSPVRTIFTDFKQHKPLVLEEDTLAFDAMYLMDKAHVHLQLVVDKNNEMIGTINNLLLNRKKV
jgi:predicted transcriptional regulator